MSIDSNKEALASLENMLGSINNKVRAIYNKGYRDGYKDGADAVYHDIVEKIIAEKNIGGESEVEE